MILTIDVEDKDFQVTQVPKPKLDNAGDQRVDKNTGLPVWATQVVVTDADGGEVISIATSGDNPPDVAVGDLVEVQGLIAHPWTSNGRSGTGYRALSIKAIED